MSEKIFENPNMIKSIKKSITNNENPNLIKKMLKDKHNKDISYTTLCKKIDKNLKYTWDKKEKKYNKYQQMHMDDLGNLCESQGPKSSQQPADKDDKSDRSESDSGSTQTPKDKSKNYEAEKLNEVEHIINYLDTLNKNINLLDTRLKRIENSIHKITQDDFRTKINQEDSPQHIKEFADEFIKIYATDKKRKSVKINSQIRDQIIEHIGKNYDIKSDDTLAINTALLIALYKSNL